MQTLVQDLIYGLRMMRRAPGFPAAAVITLGLGIGINAATFSIVDILSIKPLNYRDPSRVAFILGTNAARHQRGMNMTLADAMEIGRQMTTLDRVAAYPVTGAPISPAARCPSGFRPIGSRPTPLRFWESRRPSAAR